MQLKKLSANTTLLMCQDLSEKIVLFSYETPVAVSWIGSGALFVTEEKFSQTTSKHINSYTKNFSDIKKVPQSWLEAHA